MGNVATIITPRPLSNRGVYNKGIHPMGNIAPIIPTTCIASERCCGLKSSNAEAP